MDNGALRQATLKREQLRILRDKLVHLRRMDAARKQNLRDQKAAIKRQMDQLSRRR